MKKWLENALQTVYNDGAYLAPSPIKEEIVEKVTDYENCLLEALWWLEEECGDPAYKERNWYKNAKAIIERDKD